MILSKIDISNFRNYSLASFNFDPSLTIISGKNAIGKTNLLEAIYTACHTKGFRETREEELVMFNKKQTFVTSHWITEKENKFQFSIIIELGDEKAKKHYRINKTPKTHLEYFRQITSAIIFSPSYMFLIDDGHDHRRKYFDALISSLNITYRKHLINYEQGLRKRNKILQKSTNKQLLKAELEFWDTYLITEASILTKERNNMCDFFNENQRNGSNIFEIMYEPNLFNQERLDDNFDRQFALKQTVIGPQRDKFTIKINNKDVHRFGSRSEQRFALLWLTLTSLKAYENKGIKPILLLDDIFSELDNVNKKIIFKLIENYQTILTTTEENIIKIFPKSNKVIEL